MKYINSALSAGVKLVAILAFTQLVGCASQVIKPPRSFMTVDDIPRVPDKYSEMLPFYRAPPLFPRKAIQNKQEGWVMYQFDVDTNGRPKNLVFIDSSPAKLFDFAAANAIEKYRYEPYIENGEPVDAKGLLMVVSFKISKD